MLCFKSTEFISHFVRQQSLYCCIFLLLWMCLTDLQVLWCLSVPASQITQPCLYTWIYYRKKKVLLDLLLICEKDDGVHREYTALHEHRDVSFSAHELLTVFFLPYLSVILQLMSFYVTYSSKCFSCCFSYPFLSLFGSAVLSPTLYPTKIVLSLFL